MKISHWLRGGLVFLWAIAGIPGGSALASSRSTIALSPTVDHGEGDRWVGCDLLVVGGGMAGTAAAYEGLLRGKTVCLTEITDWVGGQASSQGTSALDERATQRNLDFFPRGYREFRQRLRSHYGRENPGDCWVSVLCFPPDQGHRVLWAMLQEAEKTGKGQLHWFPHTVIKDLHIENGQIQRAIAIQHRPQPGTPPLHTETLSALFTDIYDPADSPRLQKEIIHFGPQAPQKNPETAPWYLLEATETGEMIALAQVPYALGIDPRSPLNPSAPTQENDPHCTQGFTYTFAMEKMAEAQTHQIPDFYPRYEPYYSYEKLALANFDLVFTYRRIWSPQTGPWDAFSNIEFTRPTVGDIAMQNWTWGNDYRPGTAEDNLIYTAAQLQDLGQLAPGGWQGGLRPEALAQGENHALGYFYWLVAGTTDSQLGDGVKTVHPEYRLLTGLDSPMGTVHGLSKYPYIRESRRIIGRPSFGYAQGFQIPEVDISMKDYREDFYQTALSPEDYGQLWRGLSGRQLLEAIAQDLPPEAINHRNRARIYPDGVGISHYPIDFHPCLAPGPHIQEYEGERQGQGRTYPVQIPLRAMIPQDLDNLIVTGKSIATSHIAAAAYRVHSFEWSSGAAGAIAAIFALEQNLFPYELVDDLPNPEPQLRQLQKQLNDQGNPTQFPHTSIFNNDWSDWN